MGETRQVSQISKPIDTLPLGERGAAKTNAQTSDSGSSDGGLRNRLRETTDADHRELDALVGEVWQSREAYASYLLMNYLAHRALEPALESALDRLAPLRPYTPLRRALREDLEALGVLQPKMEHEAIPAVSTTLDLPQAIGLIYVLEGSRLGARMLHARVSAAPWCAGGSGIPMAFFEGSRSTENFSRRMARLENSISERSALDMAILSARAAFALFRDAAERAYRFKPARADRKDAR